MDRVLGVAIGIATVCLIFSILASHLQEIWASFSARRAATLEIALNHMLSDPTLSESFFTHPLIQSISFSPRRGSIFRRKAPKEARPTYIASDQFSKVLQSILTSTSNIKGVELPGLIAALPDSKLKSRLQTLTLGAEKDAAACNAAIEKWYDDTMERINGLYKRNTQVALLFIGLGLAVACNVNLLRVGRTLWTSAPTRDQLNALARQYSCSDSTNCADQKYEQARKDLETNLNLLPIGYQGFHYREYKEYVLTNWGWPILGEWIFNLCGWLVAAIAVSLGAPFWFDLINKFINIRMVGQKPSTAEDRKIGPSTSTGVKT